MVYHIIVSLLLSRALSLSRFLSLSLTLTRSLPLDRSLAPSIQLSCSHPCSLAVSLLLPTWMMRRGREQGEDMMGAGCKDSNHRGTSERSRVCTLPSARRFRTNRFNRLRGPHCEFGYSSPAHPRPHVDLCFTHCGGLRSRTCICIHVGDVEWGGGQRGSQDVHDIRQEMHLAMQLSSAPRLSIIACVCRSEWIQEPVAICVAAKKWRKSLTMGALRGCCRYCAEGSAEVPMLALTSGWCVDVVLLSGLVLVLEGAARCSARRRFFFCLAK